MLPVRVEPAGHALRGAEQDARAEPAGASQRDDVGAGVPSRSGKLAREVEDAAHVGAAEAVDRLVRVAHHGEVAAVAGERAQQRDLARVGVLVLVHEDVRVARPELVAVRLGLDDRAPDQVGVVGGAEVVEDRRGTARGTARPRSSSGRSCSMPSARRPAGSSPFSRARASTACTSRTKPRVPTARRSCVGPDHRLGVVAEQLAQHHVGLGSREQPDRRPRRARPGRSLRTSA